MKLSALLFAVIFSAVGAELHTGSKAGQRLLSKARQLENNNNQYYYAWMQNYSIKFDGCASIPDFGRGDEGIRSNILAKFKLCPSGKCAMCPNAGHYVIDMKDFVESYQEAKQEANEAKCESAKYTCEMNCQNGNYAYQVDDQYNGNANEYCAYQCLVKQGLGYCAQDRDQKDEVNMNELAECRALNENKNNNNNNGESSQVYYVGAYCTSRGVFAGVFTDSACTKKAPSGTYETYSNNGASLPTEAMVSYDCISCQSSSNNNNGNNNNNNANYVSEMCMDLYKDASKCERKVKGTDYKDNSSCELIFDIIPRLSGAMKGSRSGSAAKVFAWLFAVVIGFMGWYIYRLHKILQRPATISSEELIGA